MKRILQYVIHNKLHQRAIYSAQHTEDPQSAEILSTICRPKKKTRTLSKEHLCGSRKKATLPSFQKEIGNSMAISVNCLLANKGVNAFREK